MADNPLHEAVEILRAMLIADITGEIYDSEYYTCAFCFAELNTPHLDTCPISRAMKLLAELDAAELPTAPNVV